MRNGEIFTTKDNLTLIIICKFIVKVN